MSRATLVRELHASRHHRSEVAAMVTIIAGSPPGTGLTTWGVVSSGQVAP